MAILKLKKTNDGQPKKLRLECNPKLEKEITFIAGIRRQKKGIYHFPPEPLVYYLLNKIIDDLELEYSCYKWVNNFEELSKYLIDLKNGEEQLPELSTSSLYDYQKKDVAFLKERIRALNANPMGLGKTVEAIALANEYPQDSKILVVAPKSLIYMWRDEIIDWSNDNPSVNLVDGSKEERKKQLSKDCKFTIINYHMIRVKKLKTGEMKINFPQLFQQEWDLVIFDEAHKLKNRKTQQFKGAKRLSYNGLCLMTGTPILNSPDEIWTLLHLINPKRFSSYWNFVEQFCETAYNPFSQEPDIVGVKNKKELHFILRPLMVKNKKSEVLTDLPDKRFKTLKLSMTIPQRRLYEQMEEEMFTKIDGDYLLTDSVAVQLLRLRQLALSPKIFDSKHRGAKTKAIKEILSSTDSKVVIFSWFNDYIQLLKEELDYQKVVITGGLSSKERRQAEKEFQNNPDTKLFLGTIKACYQGLNLQVADKMIFCDKAWSPKVNEQAQDRIHRDGQENSPLYISLVCENTVDEYVEETLKDKNDIINQAVMSKKILSKIGNKREK